MHAFQHQESARTLAQGVQEYFAANPGLAQGRIMSPEAQEFFRCHDVAHVVFGCDVALDDEAVVKIASILGTTAGLQVLKGYRLHESLQIYRQLRILDVVLSIVRSVVIVPRTALRCMRQRARWPWSEHQKYLQVPLHQLRREFGIRVAHCHEARNAA
jgi:ubiquinone biosynthesis protein Coq4